MTFDNDTLLELMAYADGELEGEARSKVESLIATNEDARRVVLSLGDVGEWVRIAHSESSKDNTVSSLEVSAIMNHIVGHRAGIQTKVKRLSPSLTTKVSWAATTAGALAIAAGALFYARSQSSLHSPDAVQGIAATAPSISAPPNSVNAVVPPVGETMLARLGVDVEHVESLAHSVSVFYLPASAASAHTNASPVQTVVVWISDDESSGRMTR